MSPSSQSSPKHARVAVPAPLPEPLTYAVPAALDATARPGARVRVPLGRRQVVGVVVERTADTPEGFELRPLDSVLDAEPVLPRELLDLAAFIADYYLAPPGEVLRSMLPGHLPPWGDRKVWLTSAGAIAPPRGTAEAAVIGILTEAGRLPLSELRRHLSGTLDDADLRELPQTVDRLLRDGRLASGDSRRSTGVRYQAAVERAPGELAEQLEAAGRSKEGRSVLELLAALGRPALVSEITDRVGCGDGVVRRLIKLGLVRRFTQVERVSLERHRLGRAAEEPDPITLRPDQRQAADAFAAALELREFRGFLLAGVTGSGKTEVYLRAADRALEQGRSVILLVPEIALVPALARDLRERFGNELAILHSGLSAGERSQEWERIRLGEARVVLGPRSAIFAPVADLGLIVIDEEQDGSYKQDSTPRYHGRDVALVRGRAAGATVVTVSATPSLESRLNVERGKLTGLALTERAGSGTLPEGILVDLREEKLSRRPGEVHFSEILLGELDRVFEAGDQAILLRNRRGYSPVLLCRACGEDHRCDDCGLPRTLHRREGLLLCHYCGGKRPVPRTCESCGEEALEPIGAGTERVEETFQALYPDVVIDVLDRDTARKPGGLAAILERFSRGETQVLLGTQMVAKGHHFPRVALAAVLSADTYLGFPDFRAVEKTYNLLVQLAGRAGRGSTPGRVVVQSFHPEHYAIQAALRHDDAAFVAEEMRFRQIFQYPPFTRMVQLLVRDKNRGKAETAMRDLARAIHDHPLAREVRVAGPAPAPLERLQGRWRFQLLLRHVSAAHLKKLLQAVLPDKPGVDLVVDVDPLDLM